MLAGKRFSFNPIVIKELRSRMRGARAFITLTAVLLLLSAISYLMYRMVMVQLQYSNTPASPQIGQALFSGLAFLELMMICAITPAVTASSISSEKEKLTYEMLMATPLRPASILWGKLLSALSYVFILIFAAIPLFSLVFTFGGVTVRDMGKALVVLLVIAAMLGVIGLFFSALLGRSGRATVVSYVVLVLMLFLPYFLYMARTILTSSQPPRELLVLSPITTLFSAIAPSLNGQYPMNWLWMIGGGFSPDMFFGTGPISMAGIPRPLYHYSLPIFGLVTLVLYLVTMRLVMPARRWRLGWRDMVLGLGLIGLYVAGVAGFFALTSDRYENVTAQVGMPVDQVALDRIVAIEPAIPGPDIYPAPGAVIEVEPATPTPEIPPTPISNEAGGVLITPGPAAGLRPDEQALIYNQVVHQLYLVDHTYGEPPNFEQIYILGVTDDTVGDPNLALAPAASLPQDLREIMIKNLADLPAEIHWMENAEDVPLDEETHQVSGNGAIITLGNIHVQEDTLLVPASLEVAPLIAGGRTYVFEKQADAWTLTGTTGVEWQR
ncbi:MAG: ABC transporter permease [Anaerolineales bacterium]|jgi:ABC-2 type transport system permease protein